MGFSKKKTILGYHFGYVYVYGTPQLEKFLTPISGPPQFVGRFRPGCGEAAARLSPEADGRAAGAAQGGF